MINSVILQGFLQNKPTMIKTGKAETPTASAMLVVPRPYAFKRKEGLKNRYYDNIRIYANGKKANTLRKGMKGEQTIVQGVLHQGTWHNPQTGQSGTSYYVVCSEVQILGRMGKITRSATPNTLQGEINDILRYKASTRNEYQPPEIKKAIDPTIEQGINSNTIDVDMPMDFFMDDVDIDEEAERLQAEAESEDFIND